MLIEFKVGNYLSFKDIVTFSMVSARIKEHQENNTFFISNNLTLLKSVVIYGANASGKSNLIKALSFIKNFVILSSKESQVNEKIPVENFKLCSDNDTLPITFEIVFIYDKIVYRYGFEVDKDKVHNEWLFFIPKKQEINLFKRSNTSGIKISNHFKEGTDLEQKVRDNALFLSVAAQFNGHISKNILNWFSQLNIISGLSDTGYFKYTFEKLKYDNNSKNETLEFLRMADLSIDDVNIQEKKLKELPEKTKEVFKQFPIPVDDNTVFTSINTFHKKYDKNNRFLSLEKFDLDKNESEGTRKIFSLSGPILDTLKNGKILVIDELDSRLHPLITQKIIKLFNSKEYNHKNAQLIFATHDTNLLNKKFFRRDQIWFTEKDRYGATDLYSLLEYKKLKVRNDASYDKDYILGKYGAIPYMCDINILLHNEKV